MRKTIFAATLAMGLALTACNQADRDNVANAAENTGESLSNAADSFGEALENATAHSRDVLENAAEDAGQRAENVSNAIENEIN